MKYAVLSRTLAVNFILTRVKIRLTPLLQLPQTSYLLDKAGWVKIIKKPLRIISVAGIWLLSIFIKLQVILIKLVFGYH